MTRLFFLSAALIFATIPAGLAGPACAHRNSGNSDTCLSKCRSKWGWSGHAMGTDRWGGVMSVSNGADPSVAAAKACGKTVSSSPVATSIAIGAGGLATGVSSAEPTTITVEAPTSAVLATSSSEPTTSTTSTSVVSTTSSSSRSTSTSIKVNKAPVSTSNTDAETTQTTTTAPTVPTTHTTTKATTTKQTTKKSSTSTTAAPVTTSEASSSGALSAAEINEFLTTHNSFRASHGASALTWNADLATKAQSWSDACVFEHSGGKLGAFGENLAAGTGSGYTISSAVKSWTDESKDYDPANPVFSHFTQVVWKATTELGCGVSSCSGIFDAKYGAAKYVVCEYSKAGNVAGQFAANVQA